MFGAVNGLGWPGWAGLFGTGNTRGREVAVALTRDLRVTGEGAAQVRKGNNGRGRGTQKLCVCVCVCVCVSGVGGGTILLLLQLNPPHMLPRRSMDFRTPDLLDVWLEPPEDVFSTGSFPELGLHCSPPEVPVTRLQEQGLQGWESSGGRGCVSVMIGSGYELRQNSVI